MTQAIGFIGSGNIGSTLARLAIAAGYNVVLSNSRGPQSLAKLVRKLGNRPRAATPDEAARSPKPSIIALLVGPFSLTIVTRDVLTIRPMSAPFIPDYRANYALLIEGLQKA